MPTKDFNKGLAYCFLLLKYRQRSKHEIDTRLTQKGFSFKIKQEVLAYLEKNKYIDDYAFSRLFTAVCQEKGWGERKIIFTLRKLGINEDLIKEALQDRTIFRNKIKELAERMINKEGGPGSYQKILRFLARRGFSYNDIHQVLDEIGVERFSSE